MAATAERDEAGYGSLMNRWILQVIEWEDDA